MGLVRAPRGGITYCQAEHTAGSNIVQGAGYTKISLPIFTYRSQEDFSLSSNNIIVNRSGLYLINATARLNCPGNENGRFTLRLTESNVNILALAVGNGSQVGQISVLISVPLFLTAGNAIGFEANHEFSSNRPLQPGSYGTVIALIQLA